MVKHNNVLANVHLRKHWMRRVKCYFNLSAHKTLRRAARSAKAAERSPAPVDLLRPLAKCNTRRYSNKIRFGRGFSLEEVRAVGLTPAFARTIGIAVDHRRHGSNVLEEKNIERLQRFKSNLVLFPRNAGAPKKGEINDSTTGLEGVAQIAQSGVYALPKVTKRAGIAALTKEMKAEKTYVKLRSARVNRKYKGKRDAAAKAKEADKVPEEK
jgi:large subunit ribosomal protein L13e